MKTHCLAEGSYRMTCRIDVGCPCVRWNVFQSPAIFEAHALSVGFFLICSGAAYLKTGGNSRIAGLYALFYVPAVLTLCKKNAIFCDILIFRRAHLQVRKRIFLIGEGLPSLHNYMYICAVLCFYHSKICPIMV